MAMFNKEKEDVSTKDYEQLKSNYEQLMKDFMELKSSFNEQQQAIEQTVQSAVKSEEQAMRKVRELEDKVEKITLQVKFNSVQMAAMRQSEKFEKTIDIMNETVQQMLNANECKVYCVDPLNPAEMFTANHNGGRIGRELLEIEENGFVSAAIKQGEPLLLDNSSNDMTNIGDKTDNSHTHNALIIPLKDTDNQVKGVVVAKNKTDDLNKAVPFNQEDLNTFNYIINQGFMTQLANEWTKADASVDKLTKLTKRDNASLFFNSVVLDRAKNNEPTTALFFDIDHFKDFNDTFGHKVGDRCLQEVAQTLRDAVRKDDNSEIFRWGGEEMVAVLPVSEKEALKIADRLRQSVENINFQIDENTTKKITVSVGVAEFQPENVLELNGNPNDKENGILPVFERECVSSADMALYISKENGRNQVSGTEQVVDARNRTEKFAELLKAFDYEIVYTTDENTKKKSYDLMDKRDNSVVLSKTNVKAITEEIRTSVESGIISPLYENLQRNDYIPQDFGENYATNLEKWGEFVAENANSPEYKQFFEINNESLEYIRALTQRTHEIKLDTFAEKSEVEKERTKESASKSAPDSEKENVSNEDKSASIEEANDGAKKKKTSIER